MGGFDALRLIFTAVEIKRKTRDDKASQTEPNSSISRLVINGEPTCLADSRRRLRFDVTGAQETEIQIKDQSLFD